MGKLLIISILMSILGTVAATAASVEYEVIILHPDAYPVSKAFGISEGQQVGCGYVHDLPFLRSRALVWSGTAASAVSLHPSSGFRQSIALSVSGGQQVGYGTDVPQGLKHALLWSGTADSAVGLQPGGFRASGALGVSGGQQVGWGQKYNYDVHALLWSGTAESVVDLHPNGFIISWALGISDGQQVGRGWVSATGNYSHALLWSGTAESVVSLHPTGFAHSRAVGLAGGQQVGYGWNNGSDIDSHALLWEGTAESVVDLHPNGFTSSKALCVYDGQQAGEGGGQGYSHALLWSGTAESVIDLHNFLPAGYSSSSAQGIDALGKIVGHATSASGWRAVLWVPKPTIEATIVIEPNTLNLKSKAKWITCYIWLPEEHDVADIDPNSLMLEDQVPANWMWFDEAEQVAMAKFSRSEVKDMLVELGLLGEVELIVTGKLLDGTKFEGRDTIRVINKGGKK